MTKLKFEAYGPIVYQPGVDKTMEDYDMNISKAFQTTHSKRGSLPGFGLFDKLDPKKLVGVEHVR